MRAEIKLSGDLTGSSLVIDGVDVSSHTIGFKLRRYANGEACLTVELVGLSTDAEIDAAIVVPEETGNILAKLGWTPPAAVVRQCDAEQC